MELPPYIEARIPGDSRVVFFSDAHLESEFTAEGRERSTRVVRFLESLRGGTDVLVILGDLFDFYFEYKTVIPARHLRVMAEIERLSSAGVSCYYVAGNHDFWLGELFSRTLSVQIVPDALVLVRESDPGHTLLAAHGDGLGSGDTGYKILKACLRNPFLIRAFRLIHPDWGYAIARLTSHTSRRHTARWQAARSEAAAECGRKLLESHPRLDTVILAHTHQPDDRKFENRRYLNTGDWCSHFSWIEWTAPDRFKTQYFAGGPARG